MITLAEELPNVPAWVKTLMAILLPLGAAGAFGGLLQLWRWLLERRDKTLEKRVEDNTTLGGLQIRSMNDLLLQRAKDMHELRGRMDAMQIEHAVEIARLSDALEVIKEAYVDLFVLLMSWQSFFDHLRNHQMDDKGNVCVSRSDIPPIVRLDDKAPSIVFRKAANAMVRAAEKVTVNINSGTGEVATKKQ